MPETSSTGSSTASNTGSTQNKPSSPELAERARNGMHKVADNAAAMGQDYAHHFVGEPAKDIMSLLRDYAREKPDVAACWAFGFGILVGWKLHR